MFLEMVFGGKHNELIFKKVRVVTRWEQLSVSILNILK